MLLLIFLTSIVELYRHGLKLKNPYPGQVAEENKMVGVALRAEELRGKVAGYYIDKQIIKSVDSIDNLSVEELQQSLFINKVALAKN